MFVSKDSMPEDMFHGFDPEKDAWISDDKEVVIATGSGVRLNIKGRTVEQGNITAIATIKDNYLGLVDDGDKTTTETWKSYNMRVCCVGCFLKKIKKEKTNDTGLLQEQLS